MIYFSHEAVFDTRFVAEAKNKKRVGFGKWLNGHIRKITLLLLNFVFNHEVVFSVIGWFNKKLNLITTVFVAYPATEEYALAYVYPRHRHIMRWSPWPAGIFRQNGKWGLMTVISSTEKDFTNPDNIENLRAFVARTEKIRSLIGASQKTFAGVLPGIMYAKRIISEAIEADVTVEVLLKAEAEVKRAEKYPEDVPIIVLGGEGFIGSRLVDKLAGREVYSIDLNGSGSSDPASWPNHLRGQKAVLVNITRKAALCDYLDFFWPELVLLNEVYPEPGKREIEKLRQIGSPAYHVVGVIAKSYPSFPKAYAGGIPCCAAWNSEDSEAIIRKL